MSLATSVVIGGLIVVGMAKGHRLAWQWGRVVGVLYLVVLGIEMAGAAATLPRAGAFGLAMLAVSAVVGACLLTTVIALSLTSSFAYFRLVCPQCGKRTTAAADFVFDKAKCKRCNVTF